MNVMVLRLFSNMRISCNLLFPGTLLIHTRFTKFAAKNISEYVNTCYNKLLFYLCKFAIAILRQIVLRFRANLISRIVTRFSVYKIVFNLYEICSTFEITNLATICPCTNNLRTTKILLSICR